MNARLEPAAHSPDEFDPFAGGSVERVIRTTEAQREVWLADQLGTDASLAYNESIRLHLRGPLDAHALQGALDHLVQRHAALRATIGPEGTELVVNAHTGIQLPLTDLSNASAEVREQTLAQSAVAAVETPFDLGRGPLLRPALFRLAPQEHVLMLTAHHVVCDGWSWGMIAEDLGALYAEQLGEAPTPDAVDDFGAYVEWETADADGAHAADERYWLDRYAGSALPVLDLPTDRPRAPARTFRSLRTDHVLPAELVASVRKLGARAGSSLFSTLLAGFAATLYRITGQSDLVIGVPAAGQSASGLQRLVGHCVNLLPVRAAFEPGISFTDLTRRVSTDVLDAFDHQTLTYGTLLAKLPLQRDPSRLPLVSVMFNVDPAVKALADSFPGLEVSLTSNPRHFENFELFVNATALPGGALCLECQYNTDLFDAATIERWLRGYEALLASAVADASQAIATLPWIAPPDLDALHALQRFAQDTGTGPDLMHTGFARQAERTPAAAALRHGDEALSYRELDARSSRLARALRARGVQRGAMVGLCLPRGISMLVGLLGALKAGATYVPLDPGFPAARLSYYAEDADLALLVTQSDVATAPRAWRADAASRVLELDTDASWQAESAEPLPPGPLDAQPEDAAYVIYTSGSTGQPKGVAVPHRSVVNFLRSMQDEPGLGPDDRLAAVTTLSFDIAVLELLLPLRVGAEVIIVPRDTAMDGNELRRLLQSTGATAMQATPGLWRNLFDTDWHGGPRFKALVGGESVPPDLAHEMLRRCTEVWNVYGPTETTVWSTVWRVEPTTVKARGMSIGTPIRDTTVWILDEARQLCPVGVPGEICIGGRGVALGYLNRPELTAERFVPDPFSGEPGALMYRTGDRGRWRNDGLLEHLGRFDFQVKVRGYRIELGEIEACCNEWPGVAESVVMAREDQPGDVRLVAYLSMPGTAAVDEAVFRDKLRERLPDYMLPQHLVVLPALPRLPNGKVDRKSLPAPQASAAGASRDHVAPATASEKRVATAMEAVLKLPGIGAHDDFFALGGHSLLAARLVAQLNRELGLNLPLRALFDGPTPAKLAQTLDKLAGQPQQPVPVRAALEHRPDRRHAPLTPMQERIRFVEELHPGRVVYNTPSAHLLTGTLDTDAFVRALRRMVERQPALRTFVAPRAAGGFEQHIAEHLDFPVPLEDLTHLPEAEREPESMRRMQELIDQPLDILQAPLFRVALYKLGEQRHMFFFMPHHLVWDGWSFDILYTDFSAIYSAFAAGQPDPLPPLTHTFGDYAEWYERWLDSPEHDSQLRYWKERFARAAMPKAPRPDRERRGGMTGEGATEKIVVDKARTERLREIAQQAGATLNMLTMAVYAAMLAGVVRTESIVVAMPVRGRELPEVEPIMGFFNNLLPLPLAVPGSMRLKDLVGSIKGEMLEAFANQTVPFERIATEPEVAARVQGGAVYQALFSFQDTRERILRWGPLDHQSIPIFQKGATEDLGLWLRDVPSGLDGGVTYNVDLYTPETARAFHDLYMALLDRVIDHPDLTVAELLALPEDRPGAAAVRHLARLAAADEPPAATRGPAGPRATGPLTPTEQVVARTWATLLALDPTQLSADDRFFAIGGTSLAAMRSLAMLEQELGQRLSSALFVSNPSVRELAQALTEHRLADPLMALRPGSDAPPFFIVHDGEGETLLYRNLALRLAPGRAVYGVQPLATSEVPLVHATRTQMVERYLAVIREAQPHGPYHLGGLCAGGTLAYEVAVRLRQAGEDVALLALLDANHPTAAKKSGLTRQARMERMRAALQETESMPFAQAQMARVQRVASKVMGAARYEIGSRITTRTNRWRADQLRRHAAAGTTPPPDLRMGFMDLYATVENDCAPDSRFDGPTLLVRATAGSGEQNDVPFTEQYEDPTFGWGERIRALQVVDVPGGHVSMLQEPHVETLAREIQAALGRDSQGTSGPAGAHA